MKLNYPSTINYKINMIKPNEFLSNKVFSNILTVHCAGNFQYEKGFFIYRDLGNIKEINKVHIDTIIHYIIKEIFIRYCGSTVLKHSEFGKYYLIVNVDDKMKYRTSVCNNFLEPYILAYNNEFLK